MLPMNPTIFDALAEAESADEAIGRADTNADLLWGAVFYDSIIEVAATHRLFTSTDVRNHMLRFGGGATTHEPRAIGALMRRAHREGIIEPTDQYRNQGSHGRPQRVWRST